MNKYSNLYDFGTFVFVFLNKWKKQVHFSNAQINDEVRALCYSSISDGSKRRKNRTMTQWGHGILQGLFAMVPKLFEIIIFKNYD